MEFLVEFEVEVPAGTPDEQVEHQRAESAAAAKLAEDVHLSPSSPPGRRRTRRPSCLFSDRQEPDRR